MASKKKRNNSIVSSIKPLNIFAVVLGVVVVAFGRNYLKYIPNIDYILLFLGGLVAGFIIKKEGPLYGGMVGIGWIFLYMVVVLGISASYQTQVATGLTNNYVYNFFLNSFLIILVSALGGLVGEKLQLRR